MAPTSDDRNREQIKSGIYADILSKIMAAELAPGQRLVEDDLARTYSVSRTPIRETLFALERDGLVQRTHNRGAKVISFTPDDLEQIYDIRCALEILALRRAIKVVPLNDLLEFERRLERLNRRQGPTWNQQQAEIDLQLHRFIVSHSGNRRLVAYLENISLLIHSIRLVGYRKDQDARRVGEEHLMIVRALLRRDLALAERLVFEHLETSKRIALEVFFQRREESESLALTVDRESA